MSATITINAIQNLAEPKIFERGKSYYEEGMIIHPIIREHRLEAFCHGSRMYRVSAYVHDSRIGITHCTCPYDWDGICKHRVALLLKYLHEPKSFVPRLSIAELLMDKSRNDLIHMVEDMLDRHADLLDIVDPQLELPDALFWDDEY